MNLHYPQGNYQIISSDLLLIGLLSQLFGLIILSVRASIDFW